MWHGGPADRSHTFSQRLCIGVICCPKPIRVIQLKKVKKVYGDESKIEGRNGAGRVFVCSVRCRSASSAASARVSHAADADGRYAHQ